MVDKFKKELKMKYEKLKTYNNKIIFIFGFIMAILLVIIINLFMTKAKYQVTKSVQIVNGNVNYSLADLNVLALKVQDSKGSENYTLEDEVPIGNYEVNTDKSYCTIGSDTNQLKNIPMEYKNGKVSISISKKGTKCYVFLDIIPNLTPAERVTDLGLTSISSDGCPAEVDPVIESTYSGTGLLCKGQDDYGDTYYFRGAVTNNWVNIGNTYWRIIRINGDGTIRLIYNGTSAGATGVNANYASNVAFNSTHNQAEYVGLKYTIGMRNGNETASTMLNTLNKFYNEYFATGKSLESYVSKLDYNAGFCGDRTSYKNYTGTSEGGGTGTTATWYGGYLRLYGSKQPTFKCLEQSTDLYTTNTAAIGNHALTTAIGLLTSDEVMYAGGVEADNSEYWLCIGEDYWTMTPRLYNNGYAQTFIVSSDGGLTNPNLEYKNIGVRPVINLKADTKFTGEGTTGTPFVVQL